MNRKAIFLDRDGVINEVIVKNGNPSSPRKLGEFRLIPGIEQPLKIFKRLGFLNIVITNQPDIARGLLNKGDLDIMHKIIKERLPIDDIMLCPHDEGDMCLCRKPKPGLILRAAENYNIDLNMSYVIGDTWKDMEAGENAGCRTILVSRSYNRDCKVDYDFEVNNLDEIVELVESLQEV